MSRSELERLAAEAEYYDELQRQRNREAAEAPTITELDSRLDQLTRWFQDADMPEVRRQLDQLRQWRKDHRVGDDQTYIVWDERMLDLEAKVEELQRQLDVQVRNHHLLCFTMESVLSRLEALDGKPDPTRRKDDDEGDIPF